jgi:hypothetical protein
MFEVMGDAVPAVRAVQIAAVNRLDDKGYDFENTRFSSEIVQHVHKLENIGFGPVHFFIKPVRVPSVPVKEDRCQGA